MSLPLIVIFPLEGLMKPVIARRVVVFPQPDGPSRVKNSPSGISRDTSFSAWKSPKWTFSFSTFSIAPFSFPDHFMN